MLISVVLTIKNGEKYIRFLDEYFGKVEKRYSERIQFEYFIYENNSTDNTKGAIQEFFGSASRSGRYFLENIHNSKSLWGISNERGVYMAFLRNKLKTYHGALKSEFTLLLDCDVIMREDLIENLLSRFEFYPFYIGPSDTNSKYIDLPTPLRGAKQHHSDFSDTFQILWNKHKLYVRRTDCKDGWGQNLAVDVYPEINGIVAVTPYDIWYTDEMHLNEPESCHYYDSFAMITSRNVSYANNDNTCMFRNCRNCTNARKHSNISLDDSYFLDKTNPTHVLSAFGGCMLVRTGAYNDVKWNGSICEHHSFCESLRQYGIILLDPTVNVITTSSDNAWRYHEIEKKLYS
jgi:hypothetical protein